jgi:hypothetical protein
VTPFGKYTISCDIAYSQKHPFSSKGHFQMTLLAERNELKSEDFSGQYIYVSILPPRKFKTIPHSNANLQNSNAA